MEYKEKILAIVMIIVAVAMVLGCADTQSFQLTGIVAPNDATVNVNYGSADHIVTPDASGHWAFIIPKDTVYTVTFTKADYTTVTLPEATMTASIDVGTVTLSI